MLRDFLQELLRVSKRKPNRLNSILTLEILEARALPSNVIITWQTPDAITFGTSLTVSQLDASANTSGSFSYSPGSGAVLSAGEQTLSVVFTPTDTIDFSSTSASVSLEVDKANPVLNWTPPNPITFNASLTVNQLDASANISGSFSYSPDSGTVLNPGSGQTLSVIFTPTDFTDFNSASDSVSIIVFKATPTVNVSDSGGPYNTQTYPANATVAGVDGISASFLDAQTASITYYLDSSSGSTSSATAPTLGGTYTAVAYYPGSDDYTSASSSVSFTITKVIPTIDWPTPSEITYGTPIFDQLDASTDFFIAGSFSYSPAAGTVPHAGTDTLSVTFVPTDTQDYSDASASVSLTVLQATPVVEVSDGGGTYNGESYPASAAVAGYDSDFSFVSSLEGTTINVAYFSDSSSSGSGSSLAPIADGLYIVVAEFPGNQDYMSATSSSTFSIQAPNPLYTPTLTLTANSGSAQPITATIAGVGQDDVPGPSLEGNALKLYYFSGSASGSPLLSPPTAAGTYTLEAVFGGSPDYLPENASSMYSVSPLTPTVRVLDRGGTFNGTAFSAVATVAGSSGLFEATLDGSGAFLTYYSGSSASGTPLPGAPTSGGTYTVLASFGPTPDYNSASSSATFAIDPATPLLAVSDSGGSFDGLPYPASVSLFGVNGAASSLDGVSPSVAYYPGTSTGSGSLSGVPISAGTYTAVASFPGSTDYNSPSASATFTIVPLAILTVPIVHVSDGGGTFNGSSFTATATVVGIGGESGSGLEGVNLQVTFLEGKTSLSGAPTSVGTYSVTASFPGSTDYASGTSSASFTITKAAPLVALGNDSGGTFNGSVWTVTDSITGATGVSGSSLESVGLVLKYHAGSAGGSALTGAPTSAGTYTAVATFAGSTDYTSGSASATFTIGKAAPAVKVSDSGGTYDAHSFPASAQLAGVNGVPATSLESKSLSIAYYAGATGSGTASTSAPISAGTYTVVASFAATTDYSASTSSATFTISKATPGVKTSDSGGSFNGSAHPATATIAGLNNSFAASLETVKPTLAYFDGPSASGTALSGAPVSAGTYTVVATFPGSTDYGLSSSSATFAIGKLTPAVSVADAGGTFNGSGFSVTPTVAGLNHVFGSTLEGVSPTLTYFSGASATGTPLSGTPTSVGTFTVVATFAGSTDYNSASSSAMFKIGQAAPKINVSDWNSAYNGQAMTATAIISGGGSYTSSLEGVTMSLTYYAGTSASGSVLPSAPSSAGTYTVVASFPGSPDYSSGTSSFSFVISKANPTVEVSDSTGPASASVAGIDNSFGSTLEGVGLELTYYAGTNVQATPLSGPPSSPGTYTVVARFAGSTDYNGGRSTLTFVISGAPI